MSSFVTSISRAYEKFAAVANYLQAPLLLAVRVFFFWQLFLSGKGKLLNIDKTAEFFGSLNIPMPVLSVYLAGATECFGGLLLVIGLASRLVAIPVAFTMIVAYVTADYEVVDQHFQRSGQIRCRGSISVLAFALSWCSPLAQAPSRSTR